MPPVRIIYEGVPPLQGLPARSSVKTVHRTVFRALLTPTAKPVGFELTRGCSPLALPSCLFTHCVRFQGLPARSSVKTGHWPVFRALLTPSGAFGIRRMNRRTYFESVSVRSPAPWDAFLRYFVLCHCARICFFYYSCVSHGRDEPAAAAFSRKRRFPLLKAK